jgi:hypothetical protein
MEKTANPHALAGNPFFTSFFNKKEKNMRPPHVSGWIRTASSLISRLLEELYWVSPGATLHEALFKYIWSSILAREIRLDGVSYLTR